MDQRSLRIPHFLIFSFSGRARVVLTTRARPEKLKIQTARQIRKRVLAPISTTKEQVMPVWTLVLQYESCRSTSKASLQQRARSYQQYAANTKSTVSASRKFMLKLISPGADSLLTITTSWHSQDINSMEELPMSGLTQPTLSSSNQLHYLTPSLT